MMDLGKILDEISKKEYQVKLFTGYKDSMGDYGWHVVYYIQVLETIEYCSKCRKKTGENYSDDAHIFNNHSHRYETNIIYDKVFRNLEDICNDLITNFNL